MKRILVAGATGYLGGCVAAEFKSRGYFVRALARSPQKLGHLTPPPDQIVSAEVTDPRTLENICEGIDCVFSSIGITRQKDGLTFKDVDYQGNLNLLEVALQAGVKKFIYTSVFNGPSLTHLEIVKAHEDFVVELKKSGIDFSVLRPTGYFSDMGEFMSMARKGRIYLVGQGRNRVNPIHGADLAIACVDALESSETEIDVGGPEVYTCRRIAEMAFEALDTPPQITAVPCWLMKAAIPAVRIFSKHQAGLLAFFVTMMSSEVVAPRVGSRTLEAHFKRLAANPGTGSAG